MMGAHAYHYFVPYEKDVRRALDALREREFEAGRYSPVLRTIEFGGPGFSGIRPGPGHPSIDEAIRAAAATGEGTRSILDITRIASTPDIGVAAPVSSEELIDLFGTDKPAHDAVEREMDALFDDIPRGHCVHLAVYDGAQPVELLFAGYSYD